MNNQNSHIVEAAATGEEISAITYKIEDALVGVQRSHAIIACLSCSLILMYPGLNPEQLVEGVRDVSQFICMWLEGIVGMQEDGSASNILMN